MREVLRAAAGLPIGIARSAFVTPWTVLVTTAAVGLAHLSGRAAWVLWGERLWARGLLRAWHVDLDVKWPPGVAMAGPCVVMANHTSHLDVPILFAALPFVPGFLAKKELDRVPILAMALRAGGHVLLDRQDRRSAGHALRTAAQQIRLGQNLAIFPEGTRGDGRSLLAFKRGGFLLAKTAGIPILPVGICGSHCVLPRGSLVPRPGRVTVRVGRPVPVEQVRGSRSEQLLQGVRAQIGELCGVSEAGRWSAAADAQTPGPPRPTRRVMRGP